MKPLKTDWDHCYYANFKEELWFPHQEKAYLQTACCEWESLPEEIKLAEMAYMVTHGFDLAKEIRQYMKDRPRDKPYIESAILTHIGYLRYGQEVQDYYLMRALKMRKVTFPQLVRILIAELASRYEEKYEQQYIMGQITSQRVAGIRSMPFWNFPEQMDAHQWTLDQAIEILKLTTEQYLERVKAAYLLA